MTQGIVLDLDGTLLRNDKTISDYTINVLKRYAKVGKIILASGRAHKRIEPYCELFDVTGVVANNGSIIYIGNEILKQYDVPKDKVMNLVQL